MPPNKKKPKEDESLSHEALLDKIQIFPSSNMKMSVIMRLKKKRPKNVLKNL